MHPTRAAVDLASGPGNTAPDRFAWARDFAIGWLAGLIFFGTLLS